MKGLLAGFLAHPRDNVVDGSHYGLLKYLRPLLRARETNPRNDVRSVASLGVIFALHREWCAGVQVGKQPDYRRRPYVHRNSQARGLAGGARCQVDPARYESLEMYGLLSLIHISEPTRLGMI